MASNSPTSARRQAPNLVAQKILSRIAGWPLRVGDELPGERVLSQELGVGRSAVREALKFLSAKGFVEVRHGRKTVVTTDPSAPIRESLLDIAATDQLVMDLFEVRQCFEGDIAALAAQRATLTQTRQLGDLVTQTKALAPNGDRSAFVRLDLAFHSLLAQSTHNPVFATLLHSVRDLIVRGRYRDVDLKHTLSCVKDHERIFLAVRDRKPSQARRAMENHIHSVKTAFATASAGVLRENRKEVSGPFGNAPARWG